MGYLNYKRLKNLQNVIQNKLEVKNHTENHFCEGCIFQKCDFSAIPTRSRNLFVAEVAGKNTCRYGWTNKTYDLTQVYLCSYINRQFLKI
eukprot:snap_masked-scaffold_44-processed-gene-1.30-mRNA-1 protein AED:1.00 eAED:1.00 QI:0/-1/0/0/-1/1/1/0/89